MIRQTTKTSPLHVLLALGFATAVAVAAALESMQEAPRASAQRADQCVER